jgi:uncharacterized oligopeptide transporter (OPT) family protein
MLAASYPFLDLMWTMFVFFAWVVWIWFLISVLSDVFRRDMSGVAKVAWTVFVIVLPFIGAFTYLIAEGWNMAERSAAESSSAAFASAPGRDDPASQIARAKDLLDSGAITQPEFESMKQRALA